MRKAVTVASPENSCTSNKQWCRASRGRAEVVKEAMWKQHNKGKRQENRARDAGPIDENLYTAEDSDKLEELNTAEPEEQYETCQWKPYTSSAGVETDYIHFFSTPEFFNRVSLSHAGSERLNLPQQRGTLPKSCLLTLTISHGKFRVVNGEYNRHCIKWLIVATVHSHRKYNCFSSF